MADLPIEAARNCTKQSSSSARARFVLGAGEEATMGLAQNVVRRIGRVLRPMRAGTDKLAASKLGSDENATMDVTSEAFHVGQELPRASTADGEGAPPPIAWTGVPAGARSIAIVCEDPDAPLPEPFVHWLVWGIPAKDGALDATAMATAREGTNGKGTRGFTGAAPPPGHGTHHYHFQVFALDRDLELEDGLGRSALVDAMRGHVIAWGDLVGTYGRRR